ncbi:uncharacterized protein LOC110461141 [Mizuhopecten yessoensis]|uniref:uncharacterized protein LOC110461141 n=1 Tax=Mizuhopecten yessoensis TaxID=6573 RepID=UPI000B457F20|nr:uncharacterized protein LOC110461141 [Mizuhopecten yessoensis]
MADESSSSPGYWQQTRLTYSDGTTYLVKLDMPTIQRLENGDTQLLETIRANIESSKLKKTSSATGGALASSSNNYPPSVTGGAFASSSNNYPPSVTGGALASSSNNDPPSVTGGALASSSNNDPPSVTDGALASSSNNDPPSVTGGALASSSNNDPPSVTGGALASSSTEENLPKFWGRRETALLFDLRSTMESDFHSMRTHKVLWKKISESMNKKGYKSTPTQCENKFKSLKREYRNTVDHNSKTGNDKKSCPFFRVSAVVWHERLHKTISSD